MNTPRRSDQDLERLLADDGGELGALYRRLPRAEPPRRLDRSVLAEAARAVHGTRPRRQRWLVGFGSAAGLVLAAGVAWHVGQEALRQQDHEATRGTPTYVPVQPIEAPARRHEAAPAETAKRPADVAPPAAATPAPESAPAEVRARAAKPTAAGDAPRPRSVPAPAPAAPPPPPAAAPEPQPMLQNAPAPARGETEQREAAGAAAVTDSVTATAAESKQADEAPQKRERATGTPALSSSAELRRDAQLAPELWLARIQQLLEQGRRQQAIESLQLFHRVHPDWQLPDELRALER